jgi:hypothetical protein
MWQRFASGFQSLLIRFLDRWFQHEHITRQWSNDLYLSRWTIGGNRFGGSRRVFIHCFWRSDYDTLHDHPWAFLTLLLFGGYWEMTAPDGPDKPRRKRRWYWPGTLLFRPAKWAHAVQIPAGRNCWTLVATGPRHRGWGFWCPSGWLPWKQHHRNLQRTGEGCP